MTSGTMTADGIRTVPRRLWEEAKITGDALRAARERAGLTQKAMALELRVDPRTVSLWERSRSVPQPAHRARLAEVLDLDLEPVDE